MSKLKFNDKIGIQAAMDKLMVFEDQISNPDQLILQDSLAVVKPLCYADFVTMTMSKHESITYVSRIYCQKANDYQQNYEIPTYQFIHAPWGVEFSRIVLDSDGAYTVPGITMSTALTASIRQKKKPTDHDLATVARFSPDLAKERLRGYKASASNNHLGLGFYCVYLHTFALVCNIPLRPTKKLTSVEAIRQAVEELETIVHPWIELFLN
jgi:hypothetical protein